MRATVVAAALQLTLSMPPISVSKGDFQSFWRFWGTLLKGIIHFGSFVLFVGAWVHSGWTRWKQISSEPTELNHKFVYHLYILHYYYSSWCTNCDMYVR